MGLLGGREGELLLKGEGRSFAGLCTSVLEGLRVKSASAPVLYKAMNRKWGWSPPPLDGAEVSGEPPCGLSSVLAQSRAPCALRAPSAAGYVETAGG